VSRARVYRNVELRQEWLGLEPFDAVALGALAWLLMLVARGALGWNLVILLAAYAVLRIVKRGKPEGYTTTVLRFHLRRPFFSAAAPDTDDRISHVTTRTEFFHPNHEGDTE
jgi:hypothetical protein